MIVTTLEHLISEARGLAGDHPCVSFGHVWQCDAGRGCPLGWPDCSQSVYFCARCGVYDYGEQGGPAYDECNDRHFCPHRCDAPEVS